jgi:hypothetical protein
MVKKILTVLLLFIFFGILLNIDSNIANIDAHISDANSKLDSIENDVSSIKDVILNHKE